VRKQDKERWKERHIKKEIENIRTRTEQVELRTHLEQNVPHAGHPSDETLKRSILKYSDAELGRAHSGKSSNGGP
jgi:hypothetical protein